jgi:molecular chaperone GrpE
MFEIPTPELPAGTVAQVMQPGYAIGDRVYAGAVAVPREAPRLLRRTK